MPFQCEQCGSTELPSHATSGELCCVQCGSVVLDHTLTDHIGDTTLFSETPVQDNEHFMNQLSLVASHFDCSAEEIQLAKTLVTSHRDVFRRLSWPTETATGLVFIVSKHRRPDWLVSDYAAKLNLDSKLVAKEYVRLKAALSIPIIPSEEDQHHPARQVRYSMNALRDPLTGCLKLNESWWQTHRADIELLARRICNILMEHGYSVGRMERPLAAACVVIATQSLFLSSTDRINRRHIAKSRLSVSDWRSFAEELHCGMSTLQERYRELNQWLFERAQQLPWLTDVKKTEKENILFHLQDVLTFEEQALMPLHKGPPAFVRQENLRETRKSQISSAKAADPDHLDVLDPDTQMIYRLLKSGDYTDTMLEDMTSDQIHVQTSQLNFRLTIPMHQEGRNLDREEVDEADMPDEEVSLYMR